MASNPRKLPPPSTQSPSRKQGNEVGGASNPSAVNPPNSHTAATGHTSGGLGRMASSRASGSPLSARAAARKPASRGSNFAGSSSKASDSADDENERAEHAQLVEELRQQVQKAEIASEQYQKELRLAKMQLDEVVAQREHLEGLISHKDTEFQAVQAGAKDFVRQKQELEQAHDAEKKMLLCEREDQVAKEQELQGLVQRLNESLRQKDMRAHVEGDRSGVVRSDSLRSRRSPELDPGQFSPSAQLERSPSRNNSQLLLQKDQMIEALRMELAEVQIKLAEMEHVGDGRLQVIEKQLLDTRMANARLMEDNESFQLLLSEKTLKGDFMHDTRPEPEAPAGLGTLADELECAGDGGEGESSEAYQKLEAEFKFSREQNRALTRYIDKIIGRLLQHEGFEHIIHDKEGTTGGPSRATDKALPPPPPGEQGASFLERAKSVVSGKNGRPQPKTRPMSYMPAPAAESVSTAHENPETAPSIPFTRGGHRRSRSDQAPEASASSVPLGSAAAASIGNQVRRGSPLRASSGGGTSPGPSPSMSPSILSNRSAGFTASNAPGSRITSANGIATAGRSSRTNSLLSVQSGEANSQDPPSPPRDKQGANALPGAVMKQNQLRPLRLVRENTSPEEDEIARKKANRGSWMPAWFNRASTLDGEPVKPT